MLRLTLRRLLGVRRKEAPGSSFHSTRPGPHPARPPAGDLIFRLKAWPQLPEAERTAEVYRMLSVMSSQPVTRRWLLERWKLPQEQLDRLLQQLVAEGSLEVIDPARFAGREAVPFAPARPIRAH